MKNPFLYTSEFEKELETLTDIVQNVNPRISIQGHAGEVGTQKGTAPEGGEVDLDSIFDFLSKVQPEKHPLDETLNEMETLLEEVDEEVSLGRVVVANKKP